LPMKLGLFGFVLALYWVCFQKVSNSIYFHNPLLILYLRSFDFPENWVRFAYFSYTFVRNLSYFTFGAVRFLGVWPVSAYLGFCGHYKYPNLLFSIIFICLIYIVQ